MQIDLDEALPGSEFHSEICVIGAGIAGLLLATRLARSGIRVHLLEAGGKELERRSQSLYRVEMSGQVYRGATEGRYRIFGGSSTQWGGQILPFPPDIFQPDAACPSTPWPISEREIETYYPEVERTLGVNKLPFGAQLTEILGDAAVPPSDCIAARFSKWAPFAKRNLARTLGAEVLDHPQVTLFLHANAVSLSAAAADPQRIGSATVLNYARQSFRFTSSYFIVCTGTIESSRLLLCSPDVPNSDDQIGRYFHDHLSFHAARIPPPARRRILRWAGPFYVHATTHSCKLEASQGIRIRERLLAVMAHVVVIEPEDSGIAAVRAMLRALQHGRFKDALSSKLLPLLRGSGDVFRLWFEARFHHRRAVSNRADLRINIDVEQASDPENRILLSAQLDELGMPIPVVHWRVGDLERDTAVRYARIVRDYLHDAGIDELEWHSSVDGDTKPDLLDTYHAMGGLRMGDDPKTSVVNRDLAVHGLQNLYVSSCAVFPSGGSSNPTFTLMALTLRLADRLLAQCKGSNQMSEPDTQPKPDAAPITQIR
jgi:choline dehydrogenase-like flavoprotein